MEVAYNEMKNKIDEIRDIVGELKNMEMGNWEIKDNQMIFYDLDGNELAKYNLFDKSGLASEINVFKRIKV